MKQIHYILAAAGMLAAVGAFGFASSASANHAWGNYHWARTTPTFTLKLGDNVSSTWDNYLALASADWSLSSVLDTNIVAGSAGRNCRATAGRVEVCNKTYGSNGWLGLASIWTSGNHITQGTVKMNDTYFNLAAYNKPSWRKMVMCQEVGHTFGLAHQDENTTNQNLGTCMDYTNDPARNDGFGDNLHPNAHDYDELALIYSHLDTSTTIAQSTASLKGRAAFEESLGDDPTAWGKEISRSRDGRASVYEKDFGEGQKVVTHVFWAEPRN